MASSAASMTYLDYMTFRYYTQQVERNPGADDKTYGRIMKTIMSLTFAKDPYFSAYQYEPRGRTDHIVDTVVLQISQPPGGDPAPYDYCLVESRNANGNWGETQARLSETCSLTDNSSGLYMQIFAADKGALTPCSARLHVVNDADAIIKKVENMQRCPPPFVEPIPPLTNAWFKNMKWNEGISLKKDTTD
ncbi:uncharacterized protein K489DRAFT_419197 [Dissoconium aciculare CBS 342.82]|uniref:Uncharacterized protein n=1 Tax=Dissoconium aciculare CBS 342.82 TaxID=1314786 RepID=A0A6J3MCY4_9PEZI|nr:uncharacterized protein K489DRAFT_419197 [Dissoconium aciculare CBS 342.82]KAF1825885.1 hypothetical protein K489DRAFT_419197 [Dissoconium aciculare CBS 342.82]